MRSNRTKLGASIMLAAGLLLPLSALAQANTNGADHSQFCRQLPMRTLNINARLKEAKEKLEARRAATDERLEEKREDHEKELDKVRDAEDAKRIDRIAALEELADRDAERAAIAAFQASVAQAVADKRQAVDAANEAFRNGLKDLIASRKGAADMALETFGKAVTAALARAKNDCATGVPPAKVREDVLAALKAAREDLQTGLLAVAKLGQLVKSLIEERRDAHAMAMDDFKAALEAAKTDLKTAFASR